VLVDTVPTGYTAALCPKGWRMEADPPPRLMGLATGYRRKFRRSLCRRPPLAQCATQSHLRNGNPFDIRLANLVSISRGLVRQAKSKLLAGGLQPPDARWGGGNRHAGKAPKTPCARQRIADALIGEVRVFLTQDSIFQSANAQIGHLAR
jgi:hypothetical protein